MRHPRSLAQTIPSFHPAPTFCPAGAGEWAQAGLLAVNIAWSTLCLGGYPPQIQVVTGGLTAALLVLHFGAWSLGRRPRPRLHPAGWWTLPFVVYAAVNVRWITPFPWLGWIEWFWWAQMAAIFWVVLNGLRSPVVRRAFWVCLFAIGIVHVVLACYQRYVDRDWLLLGAVQDRQFFGRASGGFGLPNSLAAYLILLIPPAICLAVRRTATAAERVLFGWVAIVLILGLVLTISRGGMIALGIATTAWPLLSPRWSLRRRLVATVAAMLVVVGIGAAVYASSQKVRERFITMARDMGEQTRPIMWRAAWRIFREQPVFGSGAASYNIMFERHRPESEKGEPLWAHNDYLNTLSDHGLVGVVLLFGAAGVVVGQSFRAAAQLRRSGPRSLATFADDPAVLRASAVGLFAFALHLFVDFHFKIPGTAIAVATVAGLAVAGLSRRPEPVLAESPATGHDRLKLGFGLAVAALVSIGAVGWLTPMLRAESIRHDSRARLGLLSREDPESQHTREVAVRAIEALTRAIELNPANAQAWADRAYAATILGRADEAREKELGAAAERDARQALAISKSVPEFHLRLGVALDMQGQWVRAGDAFVAALQLAPVSATVWFYHAYHLALNRVTVPLARAAVATCLRLDPSNREADTLRRYLSVGR